MISPVHISWAHHGKVQSLQTNNFKIIFNSSSPWETWYWVGKSQHSFAGSISKDTANIIYIIYIIMTFKNTAGIDKRQLSTNSKEMKGMAENKRTFTVKAISNVFRITRAVVRALIINAWGIWMTFVHFRRMSLTAFVNVWKITCILRQNQAAIIVITRYRKRYVTIIFSNLLTPMSGQHCKSLWRWWVRCHRGILDIDFGLVWRVYVIAGAHEVRVGKIEN